MCQRYSWALLEVPILIFNSRAPFVTTSGTVWVCAGPGTLPGNVSLKRRGTRAAIPITNTNDLAVAHGQQPARNCVPSKIEKPWKFNIGAHQERAACLSLTPFAVSTTLHVLSGSSSRG